MHGLNSPNFIGVFKVAGGSIMTSLHIDQKPCRYRAKITKSLVIQWY